MMMHNRFKALFAYQRVRRVINGYTLAALFGAAMLSSCSREENEQPSSGSNSFFKISVAVEEFGEQDVNTRGESAMEADTIITPVNDDIYMETVVQTDNDAQGGTRSSADIRNSYDETLIIGVLDSSNKPTKSIIGDYKNGQFTPWGSQNPLILPAGKYTFTCANLDMKYDNKNNTYVALKGKNGLLGVTTKTIQDTDQDCYLSFVLRHMVGQAKIVVRSEAGEFSGLTAQLMSDDNAPSSQAFPLPSFTNGIVTETQAIDDMLFSNASGTEATNATPIYLLGDQGYDYSTNCGIKVQFTEGSINGTSLEGKFAALPNFVIKKNVISKATVTFKKKPVQNITVNFQAGQGGQVNPTSATGLPGETVTATATANYGYLFDGWYKDGALMTPDANIAINGNQIAMTLNEGMNGQNIQARFRTQTNITVNFQAGQGGQVNPTSATGLPGESVTATATANYGYLFEGWYKDGQLMTSDATNTINGTKITMILNEGMNGQNIQARFKTFIPQLPDDPFTPLPDERCPSAATARDILRSQAYWDTDGPAYMIRGSLVTSGIWLRVKNPTNDAPPSGTTSGWLTYTLKPANDAVRTNTDFIFLPALGYSNTHGGWGGIGRNCDYWLIDEQSRLSPWAIMATKSDIILYQQIPSEPKFNRANWTLHGGLLLQ